jgi:hypothetical protein
MLHFWNLNMPHTANLPTANPWVERPNAFELVSDDRLVCAGDPFDDFDDDDFDDEFDDDFEEEWDDDLLGDSDLDENSDDDSDFEFEDDA